MTKLQREFGPNIIFVFGSNYKGYHGKGAALHARKYYGAVYGQGVGMQGNSYAIPTKSDPNFRLSLETIERYIEDFVRYANNNLKETFYVTRVGCGLAGYTESQIRPLFEKYNPSGNCLFTWTQT